MSRPCAVFLRGNKCFVAVFDLAVHFVYNNNTGIYQLHTANCRPCLPRQESPLRLADRENPPAACLARFFAVLKGGIYGWRQAGLHRLAEGIARTREILGAKMSAVASGEGFWRHGNCSAVGLVTVKVMPVASSKGFWRHGNFTMPLTLPLSSRQLPAVKAFLGMETSIYFLTDFSKMEVATGEGFWRHGNIHHRGFDADNDRVASGEGLFRHGNRFWPQSRRYGIRWVVMGEGFLRHWYHFLITSLTLRLVQYLLVKLIRKCAILSIRKWCRAGWHNYGNAKPIT